MPNYAKIDGETVIEFPSYPQADFPQTSFGEDWQGGTVAGVTYVLVEIENTPSTDYLTQDTEVEPPKKVQGKWKVKTKVKDISAAETATRTADKAERDIESLESYLSRDEIKAIRVLLKGQV
jgi:hypothetical protein